jgi:hypothetical protein
LGEPTNISERGIQARIGIGGLMSGDWSVLADPTVPHEPMDEFKYLTPHIALALEYVHFSVGPTVVSVGGHDTNYFGAEARYGW